MVRFEELDDYSLLLIFDMINNFDTLLTCSKVCRRWEFLISVRFASFRYLTVYDRKVCGPKYERERMKGELLINFEQLDAAIHYPNYWNRNYVCPLTLLRPETVPKLKIVHFTQSLTDRVCDFLKRIAKDFLVETPFPGLLDLFRVGGTSIGMGDRYELYGSMDGYPSNAGLRQLRVQECDFYKLSCIQLPFLRTLYINIPRWYPRQVSSFSYPNLRTLVVTDSADGVATMNIIFNLIDKCPNLRSAHLSIRKKMIRDLVTFRYLPNSNLRDLVIVIEEKSFWSRASLFDAIERYKDLHHLAIRLNENIYDDDVDEMLRHFPKLRLMDLRGCDNISGWSQCHVDFENTQRDEQIDLLFGPYPKDERVHWCGEGEDFMKYFFNHNETPMIYDDLPR